MSLSLSHVTYKMRTEILIATAVLQGVGAIVLEKHGLSSWRLSWLLVYQAAVVSTAIAVQFALWSTVGYELRPPTNL